LIFLYIDLSINICIVESTLIMLTRNTVLFVFISFCSIKCITGREEANYALRAMFEDLLQEQDNSNENDQLINKRGIDI